MRKEVRCSRCGNVVYVYKNPFLTVDCIIENDSGEVLLIRRRNPPHGWALPGGFVEYGESLEEAMVRETKEETGLEVWKYSQFRAYSDPERDPRFHTVSVVFTGKARGTPRAGDDAGDCRFFPLDNLPSDIAFDHARILDDYRKWKEQQSRPF